MENNPRGAGRNRLPYRTKPVRIPVHLEKKVKEFVKEELKNEFNSKERASNN